MSKAKTFLILTLITSIIVLSIVLSESKTEIVYYANSHNSHFGDIFFKYVTYLGNGILVAVFCIWAMFKKRIVFYTSILSAVFLLLFVNVSKVTINEPRPKTVIEQQQIEGQIHTIEGVKIHEHQSFPSGHTATAFALFTLISVFMLPKKGLLQFLFFLTACAVGYSRLYLFEHFLHDVLVGMVLGVLVVIISYSLISKMSKEKLNLAVIKIRKK